MNCCVRMHDLYLTAVPLMCACTLRVRSSLVVYAQRWLVLVLL